AALCRSAGYWALPYPLAERLATPSDVDVDGLIVVGGPRPSATDGGVDLRWGTVDIDGRRALVTGRGAVGAGFVTELDLTPLDDAG
ncbi:acyl-CoA dehydrogenase, partial [Mycobacterium sp. ITM-2017-0098]